MGSSTRERRKAAPDAGALSWSNVQRNAAEMRLNGAVHPLHHNHQIMLREAQQPHEAGVVDVAPHLAFLDEVRDNLGSLAFGCLAAQLRQLDQLDCDGLPAPLRRVDRAVGPALDPLPSGLSHF